MRDIKTVTAAVCLLLMATAPAFADTPAASPANVTPPAVAPPAGAPPTSAPNAAPSAAATPASPAAPPTAAAPKGPHININVDAGTQKLDAAYAEAIKTLSPEQLATLKALDAEYAATMETDTQIISRGMELKYCGDGDTDIAKNKAKYQAEFGVFRSQLQTKQQTQRDTLRAKRAAQTPFIDQKILDDHDTFNSRLMIALAQGVMQAGYQSGGFKKTDCRDVAQKLDASFAEASAATGSVPAGTEERIAQIQKASDGGNPDAMTTFAMLEIAGSGVPKDTTKGMALLKKAAETGYDRAEYMYGLGLSSGLFGAAPDKEQARLWLGKASAQGYKKADGVLKMLDKSPPPDTLDAARKKAEAGEAHAQFDLGTRYAFGWGVDKNADESLKWLLLSAGQGYRDAEVQVAIQLFNQSRYPEGVDWMTKAAAQGDVQSQTMLGGIYFEGKVVPKDKDKALSWYRKAAENGDSPAAQMVRKLSQP